MKITMEGKWQTRDGRPVRILCVDRRGDWPVVGLVESVCPGHDNTDCWHSDGTYDPSSKPHHNDLIPAKPEPVVEWGLLIDGDKFMPGTSRMVAEDALSRGSYGPAARLAKRTTTTEIIEP